MILSLAGYPHYSLTKQLEINTSYMVADNFNASNN